MTENPLIGKKSYMEFQMDGFFIFPWTKLTFSICDTEEILSMTPPIADFARKLSGVIGLSTVASHLPTVS